LFAFPSTLSSLSLERASEAPSSLPEEAAVSFLALSEMTLADTEEEGREYRDTRKHRMKQVEHTPRSIKTCALNWRHAQMNSNNSDTH